MDHTRRIAVVAGDQRQKLLAELLEADGHEVCLIDAGGDLSFIEQAELTVFPLPVCRDDGILTDSGISASRIFLHMAPGRVAVGGKVPPLVYNMAELCGVTFLDYAEREDFAIVNALATAEGAIALAIERTDETLQGANCLVIGNGRIGKVLARKLALLGARVTVSARRAADFAWIKTEGHTAVHTAEISTVAHEFTLFFNTVPARVLDAAVLERVKPEAWIFDLASKPGGVDFDAAQAMGRHVEWALSLPAKIAPRAAAGTVRDCLYQIMEEQA